MSGSTPNIAPEPALPGVPDAMPDYSGYLHVAAAVIADGAGRILLARRPAHLHQGGLWEFPGGKVEQGESPEHALIRELAEELGIDIAVADLAPLTFASHGYPDFHLLMPLFLCTRWRGEPVPHEGQELLWVKPTELAAYAMPPADEPLKAVLPTLLR
jgi:8-oxo-dGTP diphosphatase